MTTIELEKSHIPRSMENPYALHPYSQTVLRMTQQLVDSSHPPYMDATKFPDMSATGMVFATYMLDASDGASDIARAIEGYVMHTDWQKSYDETMHDSKAVEENSLFFLVVDVTDSDNPKPAASLSVADCLYGPSETRQTFINYFGNDVIPSELGINQIDAHEGLWDVMAVMAPREYRGSNASYWAYSALYKASQDAQVNRWIASMNDREYERLKLVGIPFEIISGTGKIALKREGKSDVMFGFHTIDVGQIRPSMTSQIEQLEQLARSDNEEWQKIANIAKIALDGHFTSTEQQAA